jgi:transcriptional regulator with PAS, ATPase and Fis domain
VSFSQQQQQQHLMKTLAAHTDANPDTLKTIAAQKLGISRSTLLAMVKKSNSGR